MNPPQHWQLPNLPLNPSRPCLRLLLPTPHSPLSQFPHRCLPQWIKRKIHSPKALLLLRLHRLPRLLIFLSQPHHLQPHLLLLLHLHLRRSLLHPHQSLPPPQKNHRLRKSPLCTLPKSKKMLLLLERVRRTTVRAEERESSEKGMSLWFEWKTYKLSRFVTFCIFLPWIRSGSDLQLFCCVCQISCSQKRDLAICQNWINPA